jgi:hypothetical protein
MDHLPPTALVGASAQPGPPVLDRLIEQRYRLGRRYRLRRPRRCRLQHEPPDLAGLQCEVEADVAVSRALRAGGTVQRHLLPVRLEQRALAGEGQRVALAGKVEAGLTLQAERHLPP